MTGPVRTFFILAAAATFFTSCASTENLGNSGFLSKPELLSKQEDLPFKRSWRAPGVDLQKYHAVEVEKVSTDYFKSTKLDRSPVQLAKKLVAVKELANFAESAFEREFARYPNLKVARVDRPDSTDALVCELAIIEFQPNKPLGNAIGYTLGFGGRIVQQLIVTGTGTAVRSSGMRGYITIEGQFRDAKSGEVVFMFADRERGRASIVNIKDFQRFAHAKAHIKSWARQCRRTITKNHDQKVRDTLPFDLRPW